MEMLLRNHDHGNAAQKARTNKIRKPGIRASTLTLTRHIGGIGLDDSEASKKKKKKK